MASSSHASPAPLKGFRSRPVPIGAGVLHSRLPAATDALAAEESDAAERDIAGEMALVRAVRRGDRSALAVLIARHQRAVYGYLRARLVEAADAEDLCQEVFLRCLTGKARLRSSVRIRPWLLGVARNVLHEHVRAVRRRKEVGWTELCLKLDALSTEPDLGEDDALRHLPGCLESLGESARQAIDLRYHANLRLADIGARLRRSEGAVKLLMYRARQAIRNCLDRRLSADE